VIESHALAATGAPPGAEPAPFPALGLAAALGLAGIAFAPGASDMVGRWLASDGYYGHGPLVPLVSIWAAARERERLRAIARGSSGAGLALVFAAVVVLAGSVLEDVHFTQNFALVLALAGLALVFVGAGWTRRLLFPLGFLVFMVPLPQVAVAQTTFTLKILAAKLAVAAIDLAGIPVVLDGSTIHLPSTSVTVDDVCSGLRTLVALAAIAVIFAYLERSRLRAALVLLLAGPIAIVANVARILLLCALAAYGCAAARPETWGHEATGLAVYAVALLLLMGLRSVPGGEAAEEAAAPPPAAAPPLHRGPSPARTAAVLVLLGLGAAASLAFGFEGPSVERTTRTRAIPLEIGGWRGTDVPVQPRVFEILETEDVLVRRFASPRQAGPVDLYVVHAADSRKVAHPPEICFSGGGFVARERGVAALDLGGRAIPAVRMVLDRGPDTLLVYYWYRLDGRDTPSYLDHQLAALLRRVRRERREGSMVRLSTLVRGGNVAAAEARIAAFAREALGPALEVLP
jgi:EpsI family protein